LFGVAGNIVRTPTDLPSQERSPMSRIMALARLAAGAIILITPGLSAFANTGDGPGWNKPLSVTEPNGIQSVEGQCVHQPGQQGVDACTSIIQSGVPEEELGWAYFDRALHFTQLANYSAAVSDFTKGLSINPKDADALYWRAAANYQLGDAVDTISDTNAAIQLDPKRADFFILRGKALRSLELYDQAIKNFDQSLVLDEHSNVALRERGIARYGKGDYVAAKADFDTALSIAPSITAYEFRGNTYYKLAEFELAIQDYNRALKLDPSYMFAISRRAAAEIQLKNYQAAADDLTKYLTEDPQSSTSLVNRGIVFKRLNKLDAALHDLNAAVKIAPQDSIALAERGDVLEKMGNSAQALADLNASLALKSDDPYSLQTRAGVFTAIGKFDSAFQDYDRIVQLRPNDPAALNNRCWSRAIWNVKVNLALDDCTKSLTLRPNSAFTLGSRSFADYRLGQFQAAVADSTAALAIDPQSADAFYIRGLAKQRLDDTSSANDISSALAIRPTIAKEYGSYGIAAPQER